MIRTSLLSEAQLRGASVHVVDSSILVSGLSKKLVNLGTCSSYGPSSLVFLSFSM